MSKKEEKIARFDPNGVGLKNGHFIGLPFDEKEAEVILFPVPWDVTVSYAAGTSTAAQNILNASTQLDLEDIEIVDAWKMGIYLCPIHEAWLEKNKLLRPIAQQYIEALENGEQIETNSTMKEALVRINQASQQLNNWVYEQSKNWLNSNKLVGIVGGEHSVPLGFLQALSEQYESFGILQIDAHMDLREAYEGFTYSHASIFYNALSINNLTCLTQVGIRDYCKAELDLVEDQKDRIHVFFEHQMSAAIFNGKTYDAICNDIIETLPHQVYISFDIDGLDPKLCPHTGTPVPSGLSLEQAFYLIKKVVESGKIIIGFDLCEVAGEDHEWDGNVGARVLYKLSNYMGLSQGKLQKA